jgi:hypothetical protein
LSNPNDDPSYCPPANIDGAEARAYEEKILSELRRHMVPMTPGGGRTVQAIEMRGTRPDTEIIFHETDARYPGRRFASRTFLWRDPTYGAWPCDDTPGFDTVLTPAIEVAASIGPAWYAHELESIDPELLD